MFLLFFLLTVLILSYTFLIYLASFVQIDATAVVSRVIDGDTFDVFLVGRVRLADIDAPEQEESGYGESKFFLGSVVADKTVYMCIDEKKDLYGRLVCLVYVRFNSTHLKNVNKELLNMGYATIDDYPNKFDPYTWTLYTYYPTIIEELNRYKPLLYVLSATTTILVVTLFFLSRRQSHEITKSQHHQNPPSHHRKIVNFNRMCHLSWATIIKCFLQSISLTLTEKGWQAQI